jgi:hypothetical protein
MAKEKIIYFCEASQNKVESKKESKKLLIL